MSWPEKKIMTGQHVELASKKKEKKEKEIGQHVELAGKKNSKIHMRNKTANVEPST